MFRNRRGTSLALAVAVPLTALTLAACGGNGNDSGSTSTAQPTTSSGKAATVGLASEGGLGKILVDSQGHTLYLFEKDTGTKSTCTGACAEQWPQLRASGKPAVGSGLSASEVGTTPRSDGAAEVTYNGHPLYLYAGDSKPGDTNGQGLNVFGGGWFALSASGNKVSGTGTGSGSGY
jgi:predicted lipoprotein with Yx(FWY)xxD motif